MSNLPSSANTGRHDNVDHHLAQSIQQMNIGEDKLRARDNNHQNNLQNKHSSQRNTDIAELVPAKHPQLSTDSQNYSEGVAERNLNPSKHTGHNNESLNSDDHRVRRMPAHSSLVDNHDDHRTDHTDILDDPHLQMPTRKPLPEESEFASDQDRALRQEIESETHHGTANNHTEHPRTVAGIKLGHSVTTHQHTQHAPAVTHNTIKPTVHEVKHEQITRDIINTHVVHRIQPINQVEYLPARHFILLPNGERKEVPEGDVERLLGLT